MSYGYGAFLIIRIMGLRRSEDMSTDAAVLSYFALLGAPNCGKTVLFNGLTGSNAKVANYPG